MPKNLDNKGLKYKIKKFFDITMLKFILVGIINTIVGTGTMFLLYNVAFSDFHNSSWAYWVSSAANYVLGSIVSYFLNKYFTFKQKNRSFKYILKFTANITLCYLIAYGAAKPLAIKIMASFSKTTQGNIAMLIGAGLFVALNYVGQRYFVFKDSNAHN